MPSLLDSLALGFQVALTFQNLSYSFLGVLLGTLIGVLPGLGPVVTISMLLPLTFGLPLTTSMMMLAGIYYGAQYGGSTTAILINLPGEASSIVTAIDGHELARRGRGGSALAIAALASFFAGSVATLLLAVFAPPLALLAARFGPTEYVSLMVLGLIGSVVLAQGSVLKALGMVLLGLVLGEVGSDVNTGVQRFTFGIISLSDGIGFIGVAMGLFGIREVILNLGSSRSGDVSRAEVGSWLPTRADLRRSVGAMLRGTTVGSVLGVLPGGGALLASFAAYAIEEKVARAPREFGAGDIRGVAAPESANNAGAQTSFIPLLTLGVPSNALMALLFGAMIVQGVTPGPSVIRKQPDLFWGLIASMWIGNLALVILNFPLIRLWVWLAGIRYRYLYPAIIMFCSVGAFTSANSVTDVYVLMIFGVLGIILFVLDCDPAPLLLGFILGPLMEENFRRAMLMSRGDAWVFLTQPISAGLLITAAILLTLLLLPAMQTGRGEAFKED